MSSAGVVTMPRGGRESVLVRAVDSMLRALGGTEVTLRFPQPAAGDERQAELGLVAHGSQEARIAPVVVNRKLPERGSMKRQVEVLISSSTMAQLVQQRGEQDARAALKSAISVDYAGTTWSVAEVDAETFAGIEYLYRVTAVEK